MCGIAGIISLNGTAIEMQSIRRFTDAIAHRGPDGSDYVLLNNNTLALGHRRLSILDLSEAGKQPMSWQNRYTITFNGEVYNFIELRNELKRDGINFNTDSDTEVILAAYQKWGMDCFPKFNGMWAIGIYDSETKKLLLCRDRFGVKPFYYTFITGKMLAFASETIAFKHLHNFKVTPNEEMISRSIDNPVLIEGTGYTIWNNIFQLLPGHFMEVTFNSTSVQQHRWFEIPQQQSTLTYSEAKEEFFKLTKDAINLRLRSDVPIATALSGGLDSSTVYAMLYHLKKQNINAERINYNQIKGFVATFEGTTQDETEYAKAVVDHCKGEAEFLKTDFNSIVSNIESSTLLFNDITATPISVLGDVYKSMREHKYIVSLDGHGVDEMLYGYRSLVSMAISEAVMQLDKDYESDLKETYLDMYWPQLRTEEARKLDKRNLQFKSLLAINNNTGRLKYKLKKIIKEIRGKKTEYFKTPNPTGHPYLNKQNYSALSQFSDRPIDLGYYNSAEKELAIDFYYRNIPYNMRDFDRAAMQHGIEIRMPFMDYKLVNFVFSLPMNYKVGHGYTKRIMRDAMENILPEKVCRRKLKIGMGAPIHDWFNNQLNTYLLDTVHSSKFLQNNLWDGEKIMREVTLRCKDKSWRQAEAQQFWNILNANIILS